MFLAIDYQALRQTFFFTSDLDSSFRMDMMRLCVQYNYHVSVISYENKSRSTSEQRQEYCGF